MLRNLFDKDSVRNGDFSFGIRRYGINQRSVIVFYIISVIFGDCFRISLRVILRFDAIIIYGVSCGITEINNVCPHVRQNSFFPGIQINLSYVLRQDGNIILYFVILSTV